MARLSCNRKPAGPLLPKGRIAEGVNPFDPRLVDMHLQCSFCHAWIMATTSEFVRCLNGAGHARLLALSAWGLEFLNERTPAFIVEYAHTVRRTILQYVAAAQLNRKKRAMAIVAHRWSRLRRERQQDVRVPSTKQPQQQRSL